MHASMHAYILAIHYITLHCITLHCIALHHIAIHCIALHCITLLYVMLHYIHECSWKYLGVKVEMCICSKYMYVKVDVCAFEQIVHAFYSCIHTYGHTYVCSKYITSVYMYICISFYQCIIRCRNSKQGIAFRRGPLATHDVVLLRIEEQICAIKR